MRPLLLMLTSMTLSALPLLLELAPSEYGLMKNTEGASHPYFWHYHLPLAMVNTMMYTLNLSFMNLAIVDASKRNLMMLRMSQVLDLTFHAKDRITLRLPVFNLVDPESIVTWIELRKCILETGSRF
jgi:hypothetical protein